MRAVESPSRWRCNGPNEKTPAMIIISNVLWLERRQTVAKHARQHMDEKSIMYCIGSISSLTFVPVLYISRVWVLIRRSTGISERITRQSNRPSMWWKRRSRGACWRRKVQPIRPMGWNRTCLIFPTEALKKSRIGPSRVQSRVGGERSLWGIRVRRDDCPVVFLALLVKRRRSQLPPKTQVR